uniref:Uncharacterized protein n=1 Tax=Knipowitschia caucasica TaxID=637954 RepID=A0AAV2K3U5_KNICA
MRLILTVKHCSEIAPATDLMRTQTRFSRSTHARSAPVKRLRVPVSLNTDPRLSRTGSSHPGHTVLGAGTLGIVYSTLKLSSPTPASLPPVSLPSLPPLLSCLSPTHNVDAGL